MSNRGDTTGMTFFCGPRYARLAGRRAIDLRGGFLLVAYVLAMAPWIGCGDTSEETEQASGGPKTVVLSGADRTVADHIDRHLETFQIKKKLTDGSLMQAVEQLDEFSDEAARQQSAQKIADTWRSMADARLQYDAPAKSRADCLQLWQNLADKGGSALLRSEIEEAIVQLGNQLLRDRKFDAAIEHFEALKTEFGNMLTTGANTRAHEIQIGLARALARREPAPWKKIMAVLASVEASGGAKLANLTPSQRAHVLALRALSRAEAVDGDVLTSLDALIHPQDLSGELEAWEKLRIDNLRLRTVEKLSGNLPLDAPREAMFWRLWPAGKPLGPVLQKANTLRDEGHFQESLAALDSAPAAGADPLAAKVVAKATLHVLESWARDRIAAGAFAQSEPVLRQAQELISQNEVLKNDSDADTRLKVTWLIHDLKRPDSDLGTLVGTARPVLAKIDPVDGSIDAAGKRDVLAAMNQRLRNELTRSGRAAGIETLRRFSELMIDAGSNDPVAHACQVEAMAGGGDEPLSPEDEVRIAQHLVEHLAAAKDPAMQDYLDYARGLALLRLDGGREIDEGLKMLTRSIHDAPASGALRQPRRRRAMATALVNAADQLRHPDENDPTTRPLTPQRADRSLQLLALAKQQLSGQRPPRALALKLLTNLALAEAYGTKPDGDAVLKYAQILDDQQQTSVQVLMARAYALQQRKSTTAEDRRLALQSYAEALRQWTRSTSTAPLEVVYEKLFAPAMRLAGPYLERTPEDLKPAIASLYVAKGTLLLRGLRNKPGLGDAKQDPSRTAYDAYRQASSLVARADYVVGQGLYLKRIDAMSTIQKLNEATRLAKLAAKLDASHPGGHGLRAYALFLKSGTMPTIDGQTKVLMESLSAFRVAIDTSDPHDAALQDYLVGRSQALLLLAAREKDLDRKQSMLKVARQDAERAAELPDSPTLPPGMARLALGDVIEEGAVALKQWQDIEVAYGVFEQAVQQAEQRGSGLASALYRNARCRYHRALVDRGNRFVRGLELETVAKMLERAFEQSTDPAEKATISSWRAKTYLANTLSKTMSEGARSDEFQRAAEAMAVACGLARQYDTPSWTIYATGLADLQWKRSVRADEHEAAKVPELQKSAQAYAEQVLAAELEFRVNPHLMATALTIVLQLSKQEDRIAVIDKYLPRFSGTDEDSLKKRVELLCLRSEFYLGDDQRDKAAKDAAAAVQLVADIKGEDSNSVLGLARATHGSVGFVNYMRNASSSGDEKWKVIGLSASEELRDAIKLVDDVRSTVKYRIYLGTLNAQLFANREDLTDAQKKRLKNEALTALAPVMTSGVDQESPVYHQTRRLLARIKSL